MKRIVTIVLAVILVLALTAGCSSNNSGSGGSEPSTNIVVGGSSSDNSGGNNSNRGGMADNWPASELPQNFPAYPNGEVVSVDGAVDDYGIFIVILDTDKATYDAYLKTMESEGWSEPYWAESEGSEISLAKGPLWFLIEYTDSDSMVQIMLVDQGDMAMNVDWPADLPYNLPAYPDGNLFDVSVSDDHTFMATIIDTSEAGLLKYIDMLVQAGWIVREDDENLVRSYGEYEYELDSNDNKWWMSVDLSDFIDGEYNVVNIYAATRAV